MQDRKEALASASQYRPRDAHDDAHDEVAVPALASPLPSLPDPNIQMPAGMPMFGRPLTTPVETQGRVMYNADYFPTGSGSGAGGAEQAEAGRDCAANRLVPRATNPVIDSLAPATSGPCAGSPLGLDAQSNSNPLGNRIQRPIEF